MYYWSITPLSLSSSGLFERTMVEQPGASSFLYCLRLPCLPAYLPLQEHSQSTKELTRTYITPLSSSYSLIQGYLDETEQALRRIDSKNLGYLTVDKMYDVMSTLQQEQKKSSKLIGQLQKQQKTSLTLKRAVIGLVAFAVLLALANVGTRYVTVRRFSSRHAFNSDLDTKHNPRLTPFFPFNFTHFLQQQQFRCSVISQRYIRRWC